MPIADENALRDAAGGAERWHEFAGLADADPDSRYQERLRIAQDAGDAFVQGYLGITYADVEAMDPREIKPIVKGAADWGILELKRKSDTGLDDDDRDLVAELIARFEAMARGGHWTGKKRPSAQNNRKPAVIDGTLGRRSLRSFVGE